MAAWATLMGFAGQQLSTVSLTSILFKILDQITSFKGRKSVGIINQDCLVLFYPIYLYQDFKTSHR